MSETKDLTTTEKPGTLGDLIEKRRPLIAAMLPKHVSLDRFMRVTLAALHANPEIAKCTPISIVQAVGLAAQCGWEPTGQYGGCYIVPFNVKRKDKSGREWWETVATPIPDYRGLLDLMRRAGGVKQISCGVVYSNDFFEFEDGFESVCRHRKRLDGDRGKPIQVWAAAVFENGGRQAEVMTVAEVEKIRHGSKSANSPGWRDHWDQMARKTVLRRLCNYCPRSVEMVSAMEAVDAEYQIKDARPAPNAMAALTGTMPEAPQDTPASDASLSTPEDHAAFIALADQLQLSAGQRHALLTDCSGSPPPMGADGPDLSAVTSAAIREACSRLQADVDSMEAGQ